VDGADSMDETDGMDKAGAAAAAAAAEILASRVHFVQHIHYVHAVQNRNFRLTLRGKCAILCEIRPVHGNLPFKAGDREWQRR